MKPYQIICGLVATFAITSAAVFGKTIPNYAEADLVLGQTDFISKFAPFPPNASSIRGPSSVVVDPVTRKVFVADEGYNRILRYTSADGLANGATAEAVFGQKLFSTYFTGVTRDQIGGDGFHGTIFFDAKGRLWVADIYGSRVLRFDAASLRDSSPDADRVYGQPDFTTSSHDITAAKMADPYDVCVDSADRLWVADADNNRVLRFDNISDKPSGAAADGVLGQADFTTGRASGGIAALYFPTGVTISADGTLYVTCRGGNYIRRFDKAASLGNNAPANAVFGQPDFVTSISGTTAAKISGPYGSWITPDDSLWVADTGNNRVLCFNNASTKPSGAGADGVLGQPNFTTKLAEVTRRGLRSPYMRPFVDTTGSLWIPDGGNSRVLRFPADVTAPVLTVTTVVKKFIKNKKIRVSGTASDPYGVSLVQFQVGKGPLQTAVGTDAWQVVAKLRKGRNRISIFATDSVGNVSLKKIIKIRRK